MKNRKVYIGILMLMAGTCSLLIKGNAQQVFVTKSPDGHISLNAVMTAKGQLQYTLLANGNELIAASALGLSFGLSGSIPAAGWEVSKAGKRSVSQVWKPVWGKRSIVPDHYNETTIDLRGSGAPFDRFRIELRAYNDGVAFRYEIPAAAKGDSAMSEKELTTFSFAGDDTAWFYNGEHHNLGPDRLADIDSTRLPVMTIKAGDNAYMALHEADLRSGSPLVLKSEKGTGVFTIASAPGMLHKGYVSAWRVIFYGEKPGDMVDSHLLELLNPAPAADSDFSWVKPGVALWDWRANGAKVEGFEYTMSYPSWVRMVDFAAENGIPYLLLDANWYGPEFSKDSDPFKGAKVNDVKRLITYARAKNVRIWLYLNDVAGMHYPIKKILEQFNAWGAAGIKYGFMRASPVEKNARTRMITALCAKYHLLCDFHDGPVHPYGQLRTWPNAVTREYCEAQLDARRVFQPETFVTSVFVNMLAGPIDMNNGTFDLRQGETDRVDNNQEVPSTIVSEAARTLIVFSGFTVIPGIPEDYHKNPELFSFIAAQKMPWRESKTLMGEIGKYIVMARQAADGTWLVGAATNESARELEIPLSFLGKGNYEATIIRDGDHADYRTNRMAYKVDKKTVTRSGSVPVKLAPGGGACLIIRKKG